LDLREVVSKLLFMKEGAANPMIINVTPKTTRTERREEFLRKTREIENPVDSVDSSSLVVLRDLLLLLLLAIIV
jgi:hypothetical protein